MGLPLPKVVSDVGPGGRLFTNMNAVNKENLERRKQELENQYYGPTAYANAMSKGAYAATAMPAALAAFAQSKAGEMMTPEQRTQLNDAFQQYTNNIPNVSQNFMQMVNQGSRGNGLLDNVIASVIHKIKGEKGQNSLIPQLAQSTPSATSPPSAPMGGVTPPPGGPEGNYKKVGGGLEYQPGGEENPQNKPFGPATSAVGQAASLQLPNTQGPHTPEHGSELVKKAEEAAVTGQAQNQNEQQKQRSLAISNQATVATQALKDLEGGARNYTKSTYKGQYAGSRPSSGEGSIPTLPGGNSSPEQLTDNYYNQLLVDLSGLGNTPAGQTDEGRSLIASGKMNRSLDEDAHSELYQSNKAKLKRMIVLRDFANDFTKNNKDGTDEELVAMMNLYNEHAPSYDYEKGKALPENDKKFKDFTSKEALASYRTNADYNPYPQFEETKIINGRKAVKHQGKWHWRNE